MNQKKKKTTSIRSNNRDNPMNTKHQIILGLGDGDVDISSIVEGDGHLLGDGDSISSVESKG